MPINTIQQQIHLRTKTNQRVMLNIARLWDIGRQAKSSDDILNGLHPWGRNNELKFHNALPKLLIGLAISCLLLGWLIHSYIPYFVSICISLGFGFIAFLIYEPDDPIEEVIEYLEQRMMLLKFDLDFQSIPEIFPKTSNSVLAINKLKQLFPVFNQGSISNEITMHASTTWLNEHGVHYPVMLFQYQYVIELKVPNSDGKLKKIKEIEKNLFGIFIFESKGQGFAVSNKRNSFFYPYNFLWKSSDILLNESLKIFGHNPFELAKTMSPMMTLKLIDFFQHQSGDLISHYEENILLFLGEQNLFQTSNKKQLSDIDNISELRGYLRTLSMPNYQQLRQNMLKFLE